MEPEEEGDDYADESFEAGDSSPEKRKRSPVKSSQQRQQEEDTTKQINVVHPSPTPKTQQQNDAPQEKSSVDKKHHPMPLSAQEMIRPSPFDPYDYDDDDDYEEGDEAHVSLKLNPKKTKVRKPKGKKTKVQQYPTAETTYARTEEENDRLVDELLEEYDLLPSKSTRPTKQQVEAPQHGNKKISKSAAATAREVYLDDNNGSVVESTGSTLSKKGRKDSTVVTAAAVQQKTKAQPNRSTNTFVLPVAAVAEASTSAAIPKPTKRQPPQPPLPPSAGSRELQRIAVLEEREQALIEAVEDLSNQNDELIKKLQLSMANELQLELRIISLCTKKKRRNHHRASFPIEEETDEEEEEQEDNNDDIHSWQQPPQPQPQVILKKSEVAASADGAAIGGGGSRFRSRLLDNIRGGSS